MNFNVNTFSILDTLVVTYVVSSGSSGGSLSGVSALLADSAPDLGVVEFLPAASAPKSNDVDS